MNDTFEQKWNPGDLTEFVQEIGRTAMLDVELRPMLQRVTDSLSEHFGWEFVACITVDAARKTYVCQALTSHIPTSLEVGMARQLEGGIVARVTSTMSLINVDDVSTHPDYIETAKGVRSEMAVPIIHRDELVAILNIESTLPGAFEGFDEAMSQIAAQLSGPITSALIHRDVQRRASLMQMMNQVSRIALDAGNLQEVLDRIVRFIDQNVEVLSTQIVMLTSDGNEYELAAIAGEGTDQYPVGSRWPLSSGVIGRCLRTGVQQLVLDIRNDPDYVAFDEKIASELVVPIRARDQLLGAFNFECTTPETFRADHAQVFSAIANQVAGVISMASMNDHLARLSEELEASNRKLQEMNRHLEELSKEDPLTGLPNRRTFVERFDNEWRRACRAQAPFSLLMIDIDYFKSFNDEFGHRRGDECLKEIGETLRNNFHRASDFIGRLGGEEFVALLPGSDQKKAVEIAERIRVAIENLGIANGSRGVVTVSIGVATSIAKEMSDQNALLDRADVNLYRAKRNGRNRVEGDPIA